MKTIKFEMVNRIQKMKSKKPSHPVQKALDKKSIKEKYHLLVNDPRYTAHQRGYEFEQLIFSLLDNAGLEPRASYKLKGEQVDGSFFWQGQTFLLEAKWVKDQLPVSSIYTFKGKLDGKFHTTSGIFISVNGYSPDVEDALKFGKSLNILLFDETDVPLLFNGDVEFVDMLKFKLREAGDTGSIKVAYELNTLAEQIANTPKELLNVNEFIKKVSINSVPGPKLVVTDILIFVEGESEVPIATKLLERIKVKYFLSFQVVSLEAGDNIRNLPALLNLYGAYGKTKAVIVILDDDLQTKSLLPVIENVNNQIRSSSIPVKTKIVYITETLKAILSRRRINDSDLEKEPVFETLEGFIAGIAEDYYDPITITPMEVLKARLEALTWNYEEHEVEGEDDYYQHPFSLKSIDELVDHLNEEMVSAMHGEMPLEWLKEQDSLDYEIEIRQYLLENYSNEIAKLGWDINQL